MTEHHDITYLVPRRVRTELEVFGLRRRHLVLVVPWFIAAALAFYWGSGLPVLLYFGLPLGLALTGYGLFGWPGGEDDQTLWELYQRWHRHNQRQRLYLYRRERHQHGR